MQLVGQTTESETKMSASIYAALIDSLFQNPGPLFAGVLCTVSAAVMTALKTGIVWLWLCVALQLLIGAARAFDTKRYSSSKQNLTLDQVVDKLGLGLVL